MQRVFFPCQVSLLKAERWSCSPSYFLLSALPTVQMPAFSVKFRCPNGRFLKLNPQWESKTCYVWRFKMGHHFQEIPEFDVPNPWHNMFWQSNMVVERYPRSWRQHLWPNMRGEAEKYLDLIAHLQTIMNARNVNFHGLIICCFLAETVEGRTGLKHNILWEETLVPVFFHEKTIRWIPCLLVGIPYPTKISSIIVYITILSFCWLDPLVEWYKGQLLRVKSPFP